MDILKLKDNTEPSPIREGVETMHEGRKVRYSPNYMATYRVGRNDQPPYKKVMKVTDCNSKHTEMVVDKGSNMKIEPFITPENQLAKVAIIHIMYNICFSNRRKQGAYYDINTTASS